jgi:hypothetical protein
MSATQSSKLLSSLFAQFDQDQRLTVLHIGPALPETVEFFSRFRCKLFFVDLFSELPIAPDEDASSSLQQQFDELLDIPADALFDICLFWDFFNFLDKHAIAAFLATLRPHLHNGSLGHGFAVHNLHSPQTNQLYAIQEVDTLRVKARPSRLPGYAPHTQSKLRSLLSCFHFDRSVLLSDSRLELLLKADLGQVRKQA